MRKKVRDPMSTFREAGWVWEGHGFDPGLEPSIYGVGEAAACFGLDRANFLFHRNNHVDLAKLGHLGEVVPEISKSAAIFATTPARTGVPLEYMEAQYETMPGLFEQGKIVGYNILGGCLIDMHPPQAEFIRAFIEKRAQENSQKEVRVKASDLP